MKKLLIISLLVCHWANSAFAKEILIYSAHPEFAPMSWLENGQLVGLGPEIVETIFSEIGVQVKSQRYPWRRVFEAARQGQIDVIASLYFTNERDQFLLYSDIPYAESKTVIITQRGNEFSFNQWQDLKDKKGGAILGDSWGEQFDKYIETDLNVENVYNYKQNFLKLFSGRIDYVIATENNAIIIAAQLKLSEKISILPVAVNTEKEYAAFSEYSPFIKYLPLFNEKLREMVENGDVDRLKEKYIERAIKTQVSQSKQH